jgi:hypothetical protein
MSGNPFVTVGTDVSGKTVYTPTTAAYTPAPAAVDTSATDALKAQNAALQAQIAALTGQNAAQLAALQTQIATLKTAQETANAQAAQAAADAAAKETLARESIGTILSDRFAQYGLTTLAPKIMELARAGYGSDTITLELQKTDEYKQRFAANDIRLKNNLKALTPAEYLSVEDAYRQTLRAYGLTQFDTDQYVSQFIANDVAPSELSTRVQMAVQRVQNANPDVANTLRDYYGIGATDLVAYVLDPATQLTKIQRQVTAAEIGSAARTQGLETGVSVAEQLAAQGVDQATAQRGYATIADIMPTAEKLSQIYGTTVGTYDQSAAEQEVFNSLASAQRKRKQLSQAEIAAFSGSSGTSRGSLSTSYLNKQSSAGAF